MYFDEYGSRENHTVVLLHGAGVVDTFARQYEALSAFHLVVPHLYGSGQETAEAYTPDKAINAVLEIIDELGKEKVSLVGHSMGGQLAVALATRHESLFDRAAFLSPWVCSTEKTVRLYGKLSRILAALMRVSGLIRLQTKCWGFTPGQTEFMAGYSRNITKEQSAAWFTKRIFLDDLPGYSDVRIPMLSVCGAKEIREMKHSAEELGKRNPHCKTVLLPGARHDFPMCNPDALNPILLGFLQEG